MISRNSIRLACALALAGIVGLAGQAGAREDIKTSQHRTTGPGLRTTAGCVPTLTAIDLDINNVRARLMTGGDMWWNLGESNAAYEIPKVTKAGDPSRHSQFAASCWIGGYDKQGQLKVAAQTYRQTGNDYWPGALDVNAKTTGESCNKWDKFWKIDRATINKFISVTKGVSGSDESDYDVINQWPAVGNRKAYGADGQTPVDMVPGNTYAAFRDLNGNGAYEPNKGEYPVLESNGVQSVPDQMIWWVFNDAGNTKQQSLTAAIGVEVQTTAFAFATQDFLNNSTFYNYRVINRGSLAIDSTYLAVWDDADLGWYYDDFIGCDTSRGLGILYNGSNNDGGSAGSPVNSYGENPPQVALDFFQGPKRPVSRPGLPDTLEQLSMTNFTYYNNDASTIGNPNNGVEIYNYMTGSIRNGQRFAFDYQGAGTQSTGYGSGPVSNFVFWSDPSDKNGWSECNCNNVAADRRFIFSSGPFQLLPGAINDITFGCVWAKGVGGCPSTNFRVIKNIDDQAQALFDNHFKTVEGPEAPRLIARELDRKIVLYWVNDYGSNNYGENYGRDDGSYKDSLQYHQVVTKALKINNDTLYRFQGYRIFQIANSQISTAEIFDPKTGAVDGTKAVEVFQCDIKDGVKQIVNYTKDLDVSDTTSVPQIKVTGKDNGIAHSVVLESDAFATGTDKRFVNYHSYYFVAIAYSYNNFLNFEPKDPDQTQDVPYLGSAHGAAGADLARITVMPNPANGAMGTVINADYGTGVTITRVEGVGNGGNIISMNEESEKTARETGNVARPVYNEGQGPINVKVIDPVRVQSLDWVFQVMGKTVADTGVSAAGGWKLTALDGNNVKETIYSERSLGQINEQILEKYGLSVSVNQVKKPGVDQENGGGYITSDIHFDDPSQPWLIGVKDQADSNFANWFRSGNNTKIVANPCNFNDYKLDTNKNYQNMLDNFSLGESTWAPYVLAAAFKEGHVGVGSPCAFMIAYSSATQNIAAFKALPDVDIVFTSDKTLWTKCAVVEMQEDSLLAEGRASKFYLRRHKGWDGKANGNTPIYSDKAEDYGTSWFPGYAIDQNTGNRLNIFFGEDSYLSSDNGNDMIWNPTSNLFNAFDESIVFGGRHPVYIMSSKYDSCKAFISTVQQAKPTNTFLRTAYTPISWVGFPMLNPLTKYKSLNDGLIPSKARLRFRVTRPYEPYAASPAPTGPVALDPDNANNPYYTFSTRDLTPTRLSDTSDRSKLLDRIYAVPNPYYGYSGYEQNRFDTKVRIINLPAKVTIRIYSLDGSLVRTLTKSDPNTSFIDWDIRNAVGLPVASGMYMMHVQADGIGEVVLKWFGSTRPIDVTTY